MLEILLIPAAIGAIGILGPKISKTSDKKKIERIYKNVGIGIKEKVVRDGHEISKWTYPRYHKKEEIKDGEDIVGTRYTYSMPLGSSSKLLDKVKEANIFVEGLNKPVDVSYDKKIGKVHIEVFNRHTPEVVNLKDIPETDGWKVPIGKNYKETIWMDFEKIPHQTVAGTTRYGKTVFMKSSMTYLIESHPKDVELVIIDLKGGLEFHAYRGLRQVQYVASNPEEAYMILTQVIENMRKLEEYFKRNNWSNIVNSPLKKRTFILVDEAAQLASERWMDKRTKDILGACQSMLSEIARIGGALGYRLIYGTQYPTADTLPRQIKQNADAKISFRLPTGYASAVAIDDYGAEELPSGKPGRGLFKTHELREFQAPYISDEEMRERLMKYEVVKVLDVNPDDVVEYSNEDDSRGTNLVVFR
ncbi:FtsK/SpoIIIE domain-containing protein [Sutcliffiella horikoshii]|uniref:FtsK/SpoIIIE domain-containing protein n=1 Tax=Sutcliffiella horikoshii TaxID=79883 RepID=UPI003CFB7329